MRAFIKGCSYHREYAGIVIKVDEAVGRMTVKFGQKKKSSSPTREFWNKENSSLLRRQIPKKEGD